MFHEARKTINVLLDVFAVLLLAASAAAIVVRLFFCVDITDESFYIADTLAALHGNVPYVLNNFFLGSGFVFFPLPLYFLYERLVPGGEGIVLFSRACFVAFHFLCVLLTARLLKKHFSFRGVLMFSACMIPCINLGIVNFNYNTIPLDLLCLTQAMVFDALEGERTKRGLPLFLAGFLSAVSVFANPVYACAVLINLVLIPARSKKENRLSDLLCYASGGVLVIAFLLIPIFIRFGGKKLLEGFESLLTKKFPRDSAEKLSYYRKALTLKNAAVPIAALFAVAGLAELLFFTFRRKKTGNKTDGASFLAVWIAAGCFLCVLRTAYIGANFKNLYELGIAAVICLVFILLLRKTGRFEAVLYFCMYPVVFALIEYFFTTSGLTSRFGACLPALFCLLLLAYDRGGKVAKAVAALSMAACVLLQTYIIFAQPYREAPIRQLDTRVESGVYKNLYTTEEKASELVKLEEYLNTLAGEEDYYAFRDCFPGGYLMMHSGKICDITSWDILKYTNGLNTPAKLFDYYRRRDAIPDVIIYVNFNRDPILSIEDERIRYNDFVRAYYALEDERSFGELFSHVMVFRYQGGFDGDYTSWIEGYNNIPDR